MPSPRPLGYEPALDGIRAVSIAGVLLFHACATSGLTGTLGGGGLGVSVFFTLSGFLITRLLLADVDARGTVDLRRFWGRRIRRLAPASLAVVLAVVVVARSSWLDIRAGEAIAAVWSATNWRVIAGGDGGLLRTIVGPLGPTWSLAVEEQFYVLLAVVVVLAARARRPERVLAIVFTAVVPAAVVLANAVSDWHPRLEFGTDVRAAELAIGGLLALAHRRWGERLAVGARADIAGWIALAAIGVLFQIGDYEPPWLLRGGFVLVALTTATLVTGALAHRSLHGALAWRPLVSLGRISYSLYLVHWPVLLILTEDRVGVGGWALVAIKVTVSTAIAIVLHVAIEQPVRRSEAGTGRTVGAWLGASAAVTTLALLLA